MQWSESEKYWATYTEKCSCFSYKNFKRSKIISLKQHECKLIWYGQSTFKFIWLQMMYIGEYPKWLVKTIYIFSYNYIHNHKVQIGGNSKIHVQGLHTICCTTRLPMSGTQPCVNMIESYAEYFLYRHVRDRHALPKSVRQGCKYLSKHAFYNIHTYIHEDQQFLNIIYFTCA